MAFCNSCGATLNAGTKFCNKCGVAVPAGPTAPGVTSSPLPPAPPPSKGGSSALKIILIIVAVLIGIGLLGMVTCGIVIHRIAKSAHVTQKGDSVKVDTPFGSFSANDPDQTVKELGVDVYPGAQVQKNGTASVTFGGMHTVTASFETSDPGDKVCEFYKSKFPNASTTSSEQNRCSIISGDQKNMITINVQSSGDVTKIVIANVNKK